MNQGHHSKWTSSGTRNIQSLMMHLVFEWIWMFIHTYRCVCVSVFRIRSLIFWFLFWFHLKPIVSAVCVCVCAKNFPFSIAVKLNIPFYLCVYFESFFLLFFSLSWNVNTKRKSTRVYFERIYMHTTTQRDISKSKTYVYWFGFGTHTYIHAYTYIYVRTKRPLKRFS